MRLTGVLATHYHADHVGGDLFGHKIAGIAGLLELVEVPIHVQQTRGRLDRARQQGSAATASSRTTSDDVSRSAKSPIRLVHTPGHTPGSQCFLVDGWLVAGDTLFLRGCGRTDFPGGDPAAMYDSLLNRLSKLPDDTVLYPGHLYSPEGSASFGETKANNPVFKPRSAEAWLSLFGR